MRHDDDDDEKLLDAIRINDIFAASSLISSGVVNGNGKMWPLIHAAGLGRVEIMTMLLDAGADINAVGEYHRTACHVAVFKSHFDALKLLVERGANLGVVNVFGESLLSIVARLDKGERFVCLLLDGGAPLDGLSAHFLLALVKSVAVFNSLLARGVDFTAMQDDVGGTLCHHVASNVTSEDELRVLVNVCGNDAVDYNGETPLQWASLRSNDSAVRVLVEFGADIDREDKKGLNALFHASSWSQRSRVELLIALGADVSFVDRCGQTACHFVALHQRDEGDNKGGTPRMIANHYNVQGRSTCV
jgi:ankyrin repeat protein